MTRKKNPCDECEGMCCRYVALPIETPEDRDDFDDVRWYLSHEGVNVFVEDGDWYISFQTKCRHLADGTYRCMIYADRPKICRKYEHGSCDLIEGEYDYDLYFTDDRQMQEYMKVKFDNSRKEKDKARKIKDKKRKTRSKPQ